MNFPYPENKLVKVLALALLIAGTSNAQDAALFAANRTSAAAYLPRKTDAVIVIKARFEKKVILSWHPFRGAVSHYVLERSADGRHYTEAGVFFTGEWLEEPVYTYTDQFAKNYSGSLYYRLRVVGMEGTEVYTLPSYSEGLR